MTTLTPNRTFNKQTAKGTIPAGTWVVFWRDEDEAWVAHCLRDDYKVVKRLQLDISDPAPLEHFPVSHFDRCGWRAAHTTNPDYPVIMFNLDGTHYFPFPCANDPQGHLRPPKEKSFTPPWERSNKPV